VDGRKERFGPTEALALARAARLIVVARGQSVSLIRDERLGEEEVLALLLGRSGSLRAPTLKKRTTLLVGYNKDAYDIVLGD
jgi:hypothetical protein